MFYINNIEATLAAVKISPFIGVICLSAFILIISFIGLISAISRHFKDNGDISTYMTKMRTKGDKVVFQKTYRKKDWHLIIMTLLFIAFAGMTAALVYLKVKGLL